MTIKQRIIRFLWKDDIPYKDLMPTAKQQVNDLESFIKEVQNG